VSAPVCLAPAQVQGCRVRTFPTPRSIESRPRASSCARESQQRPATTRTHTGTNRAHVAVSRPSNKLVRATGRRRPSGLVRPLGLPLGQRQQTAPDIGDDLAPAAAAVAAHRRRRRRRSTARRTGHGWGKTVRNRSCAAVCAVTGFSGNPVQSVTANFPRRDTCRSRKSCETCLA
jgi:hypothetical protein